MNSIKKSYSTFKEHHLLGISKIGALIIDRYWCDFDPVREVWEMGI